jgi:hypothetical protein
MAFIVHDPEESFYNTYIHTLTAYMITKAFEPYFHEHVHRKGRAGGKGHRTDNRRDKGLGGEGKRIRKDGWNEIKVQTV